MNVKTLTELESIKKECKSMVTKRATASGALSAVPAPGVDVAGDVAILLELIPAINRKFGLTNEQIEQMDTKTKAILYEILKKLGKTFVGKAITKQLIVAALKRIGIRIATKQVVKYIPFIGTASAALIGFGAMKLLGNSHVDDCFDVAKKYLESNNAS